MLPLILAFALVPFAGCFGDDDPKPVAGGPYCEPPACGVGKPPEPGTGAIRGQVADNAFVPIAGANVTLREKDRVALTDDLGHHAFNDLEPGTYTVFGEKRPTYQTSIRQVTVGADQIVQADLLLAPVPPPAMPYSTQLDFAGLLGCSASFMMMQGSDYCDETMGQELDPAAMSNFTFALDAGLTAMVIVVDSSGGQFGTQALRVDWTQPVGAIGPIHGSVPLRGDYAFNPTDHRFTLEPGMAAFEVKADPQASAPQFAYQQEIVAYVGLFYNGEPVPAGYSPAPDT